jgi:hypothetical protein
MHIHSRFGRALAAAALAGSAMAGPAWGQSDSSGTFKTGQELYAACTSSDEADLDTCDWYIMGVHDAVILHQDVEWVETTICVPDGSLAETLREAVVAYLEASDNREFTAVSMVYNAFEEYYSC